jgi:hypothetical protein
VCSYYPFIQYTRIYRYRPDIAYPRTVIVVKRICARVYARWTELQQPSSLYIKGRVRMSLCLIHRTVTIYTARPHSSCRTVHLRMCLRITQCQAAHPQWRPCLQKTSRAIELADSPVVSAHSRLSTRWRLLLQPRNNTRRAAYHPAHRTQGPAAVRHSSRGTVQTAPDARATPML